MGIQSYVENYINQPSRWADPDADRCGCRGHGWWLSELDSWHECPCHPGHPHPEYDEEYYQDPDLEGDILLVLPALYALGGEERDVLRNDLIGMVQDAIQTADPQVSDRIATDRACAAVLGAEDHNGIRTCGYGNTSVRPWSKALREAFLDTIPF